MAIAHKNVQQKKEGQIKIATTPRRIRSRDRDYGDNERDA